MCFLSAKGIALLELRNAKTPVVLLNALRQNMMKTLKCGRVAVIFKRNCDICSDKTLTRKIR